MAITYRSAKGSGLTNDEIDGNFSDLDGRVTANTAAVAAAQSDATSALAAAAASSQPGHTHAASDITTGQITLTSAINPGGSFVSSGNRPWKDLIGDINPKTTGPGAPTLAAFRGGQIRWFHYSVSDDGDVVFHMPHDYAPGTDVFIHVHWGHNGTNISGTFAANLIHSWAKGFAQAAHPAEKTLPISVGSLNLTNTPQYAVRVDEVQLSVSGGSATQIDSDDLEPDGLILLHYDVTTIPTITGGSAEPFIFAIDIHYQSTEIGTLNKQPDFYA